MSVITNLSSRQLRQAADIKEKISELEQQLADILGGRAAGEPAKAKESPALAKQPKKKISAAGIARIKAAQKLRWAKYKQQTSAAPVTDPGK